MKRETFIVDVNNSQAVWTGRRITGFHEGTIQFSEGSLEVVDDIIDGGSFRFDIRSLKVTDIGDAALNAQLTGHLLSDDFFAADKFPFAHFEITSALPDGDGNYGIEGSLTIKGITNPLSFDAFVEINNSLLKASAKILVDRTKYDMKFRSNKFFQNLGDLIIYDDFVLDLDLSAVADKVLQTEDLDLSNII